MAGRQQQPNFWANFVGTAIILFFALIALANSLVNFIDAPIGFALKYEQAENALMPVTHRTHAPGTLPFILACSRQSRTIRAVRPIQPFTHQDRISLQAERLETRPKQLGGKC